MLHRLPALDRAAAHIGAHVRLPLFRNGYALLASGVLTSGLGLVYWMLAARLYSPAHVGVSSALLSALLLLAGIAQLSLGNVLVRFLPVAGPKSRRLVAYAYLASTAAALGLSLIFVLGVNLWAPDLRFLRENPLWATAFCLAVAVWCLFALQDNVLTGLRHTLWVPFENAVYAGLKLILLMVLAGQGTVGAIFASWMLPVLAALPPVNVIVFRRLLPSAEQAAQAVALTRRQVMGFAGGNYLGTLLFLAHTNLLPLLVASRTGAEATAYFFLPWTIANGLQLIVNNLATSLTVEGALNQRAVPQLARQVLRQSLRLLLPLAAAIGLAAPWVLSLFGDVYADEGTMLLRWLVAASLPNTLVALALGLARVQNRPLLVTAIQAAACLPALAISYAALPSFGIVAVGWSWLANQLIVAAVVGWTVVRPALRANAIRLKQEGDL